jgi:hypothetical protein
MIEWFGRNVREREIVKVSPFESMTERHLRARRSERERERERE